MQIQIEVRSSFGNLRVYPVCDKAKLFGKLTGKTTFSHADLINIEYLGYTIVNVTPQLDHRNIL